MRERHLFCIQDLSNKWCWWYINIHGIIYCIDCHILSIYNYFVYLPYPLHRLLHRFAVSHENKNLEYWYENYKLVHHVVVVIKKNHPPGSKLCRPKHIKQQKEQLGSHILLLYNIHPVLFLCSINFVNSLSLFSVCLWVVRNNQYILFGFKFHQIINCWRWGEL